MKLEEIISKISEMSFYLDDIPTILQMLDNLTPEEFTKCLEEILEGNLFFSDFKDIFKDTGYSRNLQTTFEQQYQLNQRISAIKAIREDMLKYQNEITGELQEILYFQKYNPDDPLKNVMGVTKNTASKNSEMDKLYSNEEERLRKNLLFSLTNINKDDTIITKQFKAILYKELNDKNSKYSIKDIFFFMQNFILPIDPKSQILTDVDKVFMLENGLGPDEMKNLKAAVMFLQQKSLD